MNAGGGGRGARRLALFSVLLGGFGVIPEAARSQQLTYSGGLQYAAGHYIFDDRTEGVYLTNGLLLRWDFLEFGVSVPIAVQNGGLVTLVGGVPIPTGGEQSGVVSRRRGGRHSGNTSTLGSAPSLGVTSTVQDTVIVFDDEFRTHLADPTISVGAQLYSGFGGVRSVRVDGRASVPINDLDSGVGTGEWDYALGASAVFGVRRVLFFGDASYWWFGDLPELELQDGLSYGVGLGVPLWEGRASALFTFSGMTETIATVTPPRSLGVSMGWSVRDRGFLTLGAGAGLSESSSDFFAQLGWSVRLWGDRFSNDALMRDIGEGPL